MVFLPFECVICVFLVYSQYLTSDVWGSGFVDGNL